MYHIWIIFCQYSRSLFYVRLYSVTFVKNPGRKNENICSNVRFIGVKIGFEGDLPGTESAVLGKTYHSLSQLALPDLTLDRKFGKKGPHLYCSVKICWQLVSLKKNLVRKGGCNKHVINLGYTGVITFKRYSWADNINSYHYPDSKIHFMWIVSLFDIENTL